MQQTAVGSVTIKRLRTGDSLQLFLSCEKPLFQIVDEQGENPTPDWTVVANQPTIVPNITSLRNSKDIQFVSCEWYLDETNNVIASISSTGVISCATGYSLAPATSTSFGNLTIQCNMPSTTGAYTHVITYKAVVKLNGYEETISLSKDIEVRRMSSSAYWGRINPSNGEVLGMEDSSGTQITSTTLVPHLYQGTTEMTSGYDVQWYKVVGGSSPSYGDTDIPITDKISTSSVYLAGNNLVVKRDGVDGAASFICRFYIQSTEVEAECSTIRDVADTYMIVLSGDQQVNTGNSTTITAQVYNLDKGTTISCDTWDVDVKEAEGLTDVALTTSPVVSSGYCTLQVKEEDMFYTKNEVKTECDLVLTFQATL